MTSSPTPNDESSAEAARALVTRVLEGGFEQGCWLPAEATEFVLDPAKFATGGSEWEQVSPTAAEELASKELTTPSDFPQSLSLDRDHPAFVIVTQQCDLIREPALEPALEVVSVERSQGEEVVGGLKSWRKFVVAANSGYRLTADTRARFAVDKRALLKFDAHQALPDDGRIRRRFAWWAGARYFRRPVPTRYVETIQRPIREACRRAATKRIFDEFLWLILDVEDPTRPVLYGIVEDESERNRMEDALADAVATIDFGGELTEEECLVLALEQTPVTRVLGVSSYPLDLEWLSGLSSPVGPHLESETQSGQP